MLPLTTFMLKGARQAARLLLRDYFELEGLQSSVRSTADFVKRSEDKVREVLHEELMRYTNCQILQPNAKIEQNKAAYFMLTILDGATNLSRALPFFATTLVACTYKDDKLTPKVCIINFPATGEMVYAELGNGAFVEKIQAQTSQSALRLRVSKTSSFSNALVASDEYADNSRIFGCTAYSGYLLAAGKIDVMYSNAASEATRFALELLVKEAGGRICAEEELFGQKAKMILMNDSLKQ
ncbi:MAG: inositol monophosphatase family protein [Pseudomonadota bacterium]